MFVLIWMHFPCWFWILQWYSLILKIRWHFGYAACAALIKVLTSLEGKKELRNLSEWRLLWQPFYPLYICSSDHNLYSDPAYQISGSGLGPNFLNQCCTYLPNRKLSVPPPQELSNTTFVHVLFDRSWAAMGRRRYGSNGTRHTWNAFKTLIVFPEIDFYLVCWYMLISDFDAILSWEHLACIFYDEGEQVWNQTWTSLRQQGLQLSFEDHLCTACSWISEGLP